MMSPTVIRGFSEAYGSWKITWISRRTSRHLPPPDRVKMSRPRYQAWPPVAFSRRRMVRALVVLPQPDSPTRPSVSPRCSSNDDVVHRLDRADLAS